MYCPAIHNNCVKLGCEWYNKDTTRCSIPEIPAALKSLVAAIAVSSVRAEMSRPAPASVETPVEPKAA